MPAPETSRPVKRVKATPIFSTMRGQTPSEPMLNLRNVRLRRGAEPLIEAATTSVFRGDKVGIVGRNGSGKSTLLALIRGELTPDLGDYDAPANLAIASVAQHVPDTDRSVVDFVVDGDVELRSLEAAIERARAANDGSHEANLLAEFETLGGYTARSRAASLLDGLGFDPLDIDRPVNAFSGGLRMRAALASTLMRRSDVLLLDEPTNHLDLDAVLWLEGWLKAWSGTLLLVSHDREFLDSIVNRILHIQNRKLTSWSGNYSSFETQHAASRAMASAGAEKQRRQAEHLRAFIARFKAKASKARQAQSRVKWLERLPQIVEQQEEESFDWQFRKPRKLPRPLITLDDVAAGYGERRVLDKLRMSLAPDERLGILGRNGAGKSTLMRVLAGELAPLSGDVTMSPDMESGFFAQLEVDQLDSSSTALLELTRRGGDDAARWSEQQRRAHLGQFGFRGDRVFEPVHQFSGGERARLSLAILVARRPNVLLLDEPTNHLDFDMRNSLLLALQEFSGAVVVVSHDRTLLRGICDRFILVANARATEFDGDLDDYARWLAADNRADNRANGRGAGADSAAAASAAAQSAGNRRETKRREAEARNRLSVLRAELRELESALPELLTRRAELERQLANADFYQQSTGAQQRELRKQHASVVAQVDLHETRWIELSDELASN